MRLAFLFFVFLVIAQSEAAPERPVKIGVVGLTHSHVHWIFGREDRKDIDITGIVEPDLELAKRFAEQYNFPMSMVYPSMQAMIQAVEVDAVTAFGSIYEHLEVVRTFAPLGIHVMVEKPLAVSVAHAKEMELLANKYGIHLLTNYETTWYASNQEAYRLLHEEKALGEVRKVVVHDGHEGPMEIGVNQEFLEWLTDPVGNGGGAVIDFGCYGANLLTWLMNGEKPTAVTAVLQQFKPDIYPKVDDEATIILHYPKTQGIIQASWNWPFSRKDMEVYGQHGYVIAADNLTVRSRLQGDNKEQSLRLTPRLAPYDDPFSFFAAVVRGKIKIGSKDLSSLENNVTVVEILEAAKKSAETGKTVLF
ncbi:MAG TPA: Gfo/Idh/MocA family oxidoreductase [Cyclobacteriaceae bacterium]|nr:Gfo/Idh/MocA family oxidoreductase [Cyclobacteriaceae bacterium]